MVVSGDFCGQQQFYKWFILAFDNCYWNCCRKLAEAVNPLPHSNCRKFVQQLHSICWNHQVCYKNNKKAYLLIISVYIKIFLLLYPLPFILRGTWILDPRNPFPLSKSCIRPRSPTKTTYEPYMETATVKLRAGARLG